MKLPYALFVLSLSFSASSAFAFSDVTTGDRYAEAIYYLENHGMIKGYADGSFRPDASINRVEFLKIVYLATTGLNEKEFEEARVCRHRVPYSDVSMTDWYHVYLCSADSQGIIDGYPDGTFKPQQGINFVEASKIIAEAFHREKQYLSMPITDETPWYKKYVIFLERERAIPQQITVLDQPLTRGQMAEIMYRIDSGYIVESSRTYQQFTRESVEPQEYNRPEIFSFNVKPSAPSHSLYFFPQTGQAAFVSNDGDTMNTFDASYASAVLKAHEKKIADKSTSLGEFIMIRDIDDDGVSEVLLQETEEPVKYTVWKYEINEFTKKPWMFPKHYNYQLP